MTAHISSDNPKWARLLLFAQACSSPISPHVLLQQTYGTNNGRDLANELYNFVGKWLGATLFSQMQSMAGGVEGNGFELWRVLFKDNESGNAITESNGRI